MIVERLAHQTAKVTHATRADRTRRARLRLLYAFALSIALNLIAWILASTHATAVHTVQPRERVVISLTHIRIEHRAKFHPHAAVAIPRPKRAPRVRRHAAPQPPDITSFAPGAHARIALPNTWSKQKLGNINETPTTLYLDWTKQTASFVPRVFLWQKKMEPGYMERSVSLQDGVTSILTSLRHQGARFSASRAARVCRGRWAGWFLAYIKPDDDPPLQVEETISVANGTVFRATYIRPVGQAEDPQVRRALNTLCF